MDPPNHSFREYYSLPRAPRLDNQRKEYPFQNYPHHRYLPHPSPISPRDQAYHYLPSREAYRNPGHVGPSQMIYSDESPPNSAGPSTLTQPLPSNMKRVQDTPYYPVDNSKRVRYIMAPEQDYAQPHVLPPDADDTSGTHHQSGLRVTIPSNCMNSKHVDNHPHRTSSVHEYPEQIYPRSAPIDSVQPSPIEQFSPFPGLGGHGRTASGQSLPSIWSREVLGDQYGQPIEPTTYSVMPPSDSRYGYRTANTYFQDPWQASPRSHPPLPQDTSKISPRTSREMVSVSTPQRDRNSFDYPRVPAATSSMIPLMMSAARREARQLILNSARQLASLPTPNEQSESADKKTHVISCLYSFNGACETAIGDGGRTVIMHLVGRNKTEATSLKNRGLIEKCCRRHYQRIRYHTLGAGINQKPENGYYAVIQGILMENIWDRVDREDPHAEWQICFTKSAGSEYMTEKRRQQAVARNEDFEDVTAGPEASLNGQFPETKSMTNRKWARALLQYETFEHSVLSKHVLNTSARKDYKTTQQCRAAMHWLLDRLADARAHRGPVELFDVYELPDIEFLCKVPIHLVSRDN